MTTENRNTANAAARYDEKLRSVADQLRKIADDVEHDGKARVAVTGWRVGEMDYLYPAQRVVHVITWGIANLSLGHLIDAADNYHSVVAFEKGDRR